MRLAELCAATGVPSATVKYYLREGLLPAGEWVSATRAEYGPEHVERLRLIRALVDGAPTEHRRGPPDRRGDRAAAAVAARLLRGRAAGDQRSDAGGRGDRGDAARRSGGSGGATASRSALAHLQAALDTAARAGFAVTGERLVAYGQALRRRGAVRRGRADGGPGGPDAERRAAARRGRDRRHGPRARGAAATGPGAGERTTLRRGFRPRRGPHPSRREVNSVVNVTNDDRSWPSAERWRLPGSTTRTCLRNRPLSENVARLLRHVRVVEAGMRRGPSLLAERSASVVKRDE